MVIQSFETTAPKIGDRVYLASTAVIVGDVTLGDDVSVWHQAVVRGDINWIRIGARSNLQDGVIVHVESGSCPTLIEDEVSVGHGAILHGCRIAAGALVGMGATVLNDAVIGAGALIAAGSVVREGFEVPPHTLAAGVPAVVKRCLSDDEVLRVARTAGHYVAYKNRYLAEGDGALQTSGGVK